MRNNFYLSAVIFFISLCIMLLSKDILVGIYIYIYYDILHIDFAFKKAFVIALIFFLPCFFWGLLKYKYGKDSKYRKQKRLKEKLTYKIINERYREKEREKD